MKTLKIMLFVGWLIFPSLSSCQSKSKMTFSVEVVDDKGTPIPDCEVGAIIYESKGNPYKQTGSSTDKKGVAHFDLSSRHSRMAYGATAPTGYYRTPGEEYFFKGPNGGTWQPEKVKLKTILKRIKKPIAMYAKKGPQTLPAVANDVGYDLIVGDWVRPDGKGKVSDIIFHIKIDEISRHEFTSILTVRFPNKGDGLIPFEAPIHAHGSRFRSDYTAPETGYKSELAHTRVRKPKQAEVNTRKNTMNYYIRVRSKLDAKENVVTAHYGKIYGDFMKFTHYLNPTPNDRNVEFDPKKNLIDTGRRGHKVQKP